MSQWGLDKDIVLMHWHDKRSTTSGCVHQARVLVRRAVDGGEGDQLLIRRDDRHVREPEAVVAVAARRVGCRLVRGVHGARDQIGEDEAADGARSAVEDHVV